MAELLGAEMPSFGFSMPQIDWMMIFIVLILMIAGSIVVYVVYMNRIFNRKVILFENVGGTGYRKVYQDRARIVKVGDGGEEILYLRKKRVYRTAYGQKMGNRTYWFAVGQDGYWYNIVLGDLDAKMGMLDIEPIDRDVRYMHVAVRKNIAENYKKQKFMEKYGSMIFGLVALFILLIGGWFIIDKTAQMLEATMPVLSKLAESVNSLNTIIEQLNQIIEGGATIKPAV